MINGGTVRGMIDKINGTVLRGRWNFCRSSGAACHPLDAAAESTEGGRMMLMIKCDRCGKAINFSDKNNDTGIVLRGSFDGNGNLKESQHEIDLCLSCRRDFETWMQTWLQNSYGR